VFGRSHTSGRLPPAGGDTAPWEASNVVSEVGFTWSLPSDESPIEVNFLILCVGWSGPVPLVIFVALGRVLTLEVAFIRAYRMDASDCSRLRGCCGVP